MKSPWLIISTALLLLLSVLMPHLPFPSKKYDYFFMIDITRSMNVEDYQNQNGDPISRLEKVKADALSAVQKLPCGSRVGLGVFTERMPTLLFTPMEVCADYPEIRESIKRIDWRMAWVADSNIIQALANTLELMHTVELNDTTLVFFTDGQEAPPINARYAPDLAELQTSEDNQPPPIKGLLVGTGDHALSRIPKYDEEGVQIGFYTAEDVPQGTTFGLPEDPSKIEGYVPRNAPWGNQSRAGNEHLSNVKEEYLKSLAEPAKLHYHHLQSASELYNALTHDDFSQRHIRQTDLSFIPAALAMFCLFLAYLPESLVLRKKGVVKSNPVQAPH
ncbi:vWA domain-containing protein [Methylophaga pinxianii]|uniref:vWA domain-containing protein n=1 Tax=Methylophaga pinxianii TaxID=2881052 RepID=UPI001CF4330D|nr:VWA domain-containing protein [Methylophaga pinxianii]MCB2426760.1 VWA domain-containing protein [Methylophaga pinxianii]UPH45789.1 VWA domain-containing protein [Methylophaga pinxianii]